MVAAAAPEEALPARRTALVTGASAGIGRELARVFAEHDYDLVLVARRRERLDHVADELRKRGDVGVLVIDEDLADPQAPDRIHHHLALDGIHVDALVNNAGYALDRSLCESEWAEQADLVQVLATSVAHLCRLFAPAMAERGFGRILNVASIAVWAPPARGSLYAACKAFVVQLSLSLDVELRDRGVHVTALCPGFTLSEFHDVMGTRAAVSRLPRFLWMDARTVAEQGYRAVEEGRRVYVNGLVNRAVVLLCRVLPAGLVEALRTRLGGGRR